MIGLRGQDDRRPSLDLLDPWELDKDDVAGEQGGSHCLVGVLEGRPRQVLEILLRPLVRFVDAAEHVKVRETVCSVSLRKWGGRCRMSSSRAG